MPQPPQPPPRPPQPDSGGYNNYIPPQVQQALTKQLQQSVPPNMRQYVTPYMQQKMMSSPRVTMPVTPHSSAHLPVMHQPRPRFQSAAASPPPAETVVQPDQGVAAPLQPYDFMNNTVPQTGPSLLTRLPGSSSLLGRVVLIGGGLLILLIIFAVVKGVLSGGSSLTPYITVAQDQQALIHTVENITQQQTSQPQNLSTTSQNFAATADLALSSSQTQLLAYLKTNKAKVTTKVLNLKVSKAADQQLTAAQAAGTYDQTFKNLAQTQLTAYSNDLKRTYQHTTGKIGRGLLLSDYNQAQLLLTQLSPTAVRPLGVNRVQPPDRNCAGSVLAPLSTVAARSKPGYSNVFC